MSSGDGAGGAGTVDDSADASSAPAALPADELAALRAHLLGVRAVLLDIDHTLVDTAQGFARALAASLIPQLRERLGAGRAGELDAAALIARWSADPEDHYRRFTRGETDYRTQRRARVDEIARWLGLGPASDAEFTDFERAFDEVFAPSCEAFSEVRGVLEALAGAGIALGAVSNAGRALQERKLAAAGLTDLVPLLVTVETFGVGKPDPRVFREGAALLGAAPEETAYIGDEPDVDAQAASSAGLRGVLLRRRSDRRDLSRREVPSDQRLYREVGDLTALAAVWALPLGRRTG